MFIVLTGKKDRKVRIQLENILYYRPYNDGTYIKLVSTDVYVKESPETLDRLLIEGYVTVKQV